MARSAYLHRIKAARDLLATHGQAPAGMLPEPIERSWSRCLEGGLNLEYRPQLEPLTEPELHLLQEQNARLLQHALPEMESLRGQLLSSHSLIMLTDADGTILHAMGDTGFADKAQRVALKPGVSWREENTGTNAIGTALVEETPVYVAGAEHYFDQNGFLTCSAAPIFSPQGAVIGVLDVSGDYRKPLPHALAMVRMSAQMIENRLIVTEFPQHLMVRFHARPELIGTLWEGIAVFDPSGRLLAMNRSAHFLLGLHAGVRHSERFEALFDASLAGLIEATQRNLPNSTPCVSQGGVRLYLKIDGPGLAPAPSRPSTAAPARSATAALDALDLGDAVMHQALARVRKVLGRDIAVLIQGETGTGKEMLAKAIHQAQPGRGEFVAINCASIPEGLIEAELFGYEEGAFTGARRKGAAGKLLQANHGTLFLDEIGEMPLHLQARLLRVLQEREIVPLGGGRGIPVEFTLVSATNCRLQELVALKQFREDLYYRLNGLRVSLPALRERSDLAALVERILAEEAPHAVTLHADTLELLLKHRWPGNIRQLRNVLKAALAFVEEGWCIEPQHLPEDFYDELQQGAVGAPPPVAATASSELAQMQEAIRAHAGNMTAAARQLGIGRATLYRRLKKYGAA